MCIVYRVRHTGPGHSTGHITLHSVNSYSRYCYGFDYYIILVCVVCLYNVVYLFITHVITVCLFK